MKSLKLAVAAAILAILPISAQAADETTLMDNLGGQSSGFMNALRETFGKVYLTVPVYDIASASNVNEGQGNAEISVRGGGYAVSPVAGKITAMYSTLLLSDNGEDTTLLTTSEATLNGETVLVTFIGGPSANGGTEVTGGNITIASGSAQGATDSATPTAANTVAQGSLIVIESNGGTSEDADVFVVIEIDRSE